MDYEQQLAMAIAASLLDSRGGGKVKKEPKSPQRASRGERETRGCSVCETPYGLLPTPCLHPICGGCFTSWRASKGASPPCPVCRTRLTGMDAGAGGAGGAAPRPPASKRGPKAASRDRCGGGACYESEESSSCDCSECMDSDSDSECDSDCSSCYPTSDSDCETPKRRGGGARAKTSKAKSTKSKAPKSKATKSKATKKESKTRGKAGDVIFVEGYWVPGHERRVGHRKSHK